MPEYVCDICSKVFKQKSQYVNHKNRKTPCVKQTPSVVPVEEEPEIPFSVKFDGIDLFETYSYELTE